MLLFVLAFGASIALLRLLQPVGSFTISSLTLADDTKSVVNINWPASSQASIGTTASGILSSKPNQVPQPTASTAKLLTALTILQAKPLRSGEQGPLITMRQQDLAIYNEYYAKDGSLATVQLGEQLSQYQMLQGILVRSANNFADSLAIWAFGSLEAYQRAAQTMAGELGMAHTAVGIDASGFSPTTTSTADDLTRLGIAAMKNDVIKDIVRQSTVSLPIDGAKPNTNWLLGTDGVIGIKTGTTNEAGGVFIIASEYTPKNEQPIIIVGAVQGEPTSYGAITEAQQLLNQAKPLFVRKTVAQKGERVTDLQTPWGETVGVVAAKDISLFSWQGTKVEPKMTLYTKQPPLPAGAAVGKVMLGNDSVELVTTKPIQGPSWWWRMTANSLPNRR